MYNHVYSIICRALLLPTQNAFPIMSTHAIKNVLVKGEGLEPRLLNMDVHMCNLGTRLLSSNSGAHSSCTRLGGKSPGNTSLVCIGSAFLPSYIHVLSLNSPVYQVEMLAYFSVWVI